ncbi:MAG TPA: phosphatase PAP2 family protein [Candidatus Polarisedimenticolaceae bacterium]
MRARDTGWKAVWTLAVAAFFVGGYFGVGLSAAPSAARELGTALDAAIPFVPWTVWIYLAVFPMAFLPLFVVRSRALFTRTMVAYAAVMAVSFVVFATYPVTSRGLRAGPAALDPSAFSEWAVGVLYRLDPPVNLFPSLHLSVAGLAAFAAWEARRVYGAFAFAAAAAIGVSICTVKQHFVVDGVAGAALAVAAWAAFLRGHRADPGEPGTYGAPGVLAYLALLAAMYAGFWVLFASS